MSDVPTRVKICGLTRLEDAELAAQLGAWALGMVFFADSPRRCSLSEAERIAGSLRRKVELCGVFVNAHMDEIVAVSEQLGLTLVQLHGDEGPSFCSEAARRTGARVIKAIQVSDAGDLRDAERYHVNFHLLDARSSTAGREHLRGGTGETFDWRLLSQRRSKVPLILSGGLDPHNVSKAIELVRPYAVDSASGTERAPGRKDPDRLQAFFEHVANTSDGNTGRGPDADEGSVGQPPPVGSPV